MNFWLMKSEPAEFSIDDLRNCPDKTEAWDGVRNYQARNMLRDEIKKNDLAFFYHSNCTKPGIVGIMTINKEGYPDPTAFDPNHKHYDPKSNPDNPRWYLVDVKFKQKFRRTITLAELRDRKSLQTMKLLHKGNRLSVIPVTKKEWEYILGMQNNR
jgi:predicted RNA-binding protein with PUA-like domain